MLERGPSGLRSEPFGGGARDRTRSRGRRKSCGVGAVIRSRRKRLKGQTIRKSA